MPELLNKGLHNMQCIILALFAPGFLLYITTVDFLCVRFLTNSGSKLLVFQIRECLGDLRDRSNQGTKKLIFFGPAAGYFDN